MKNNAPTALPRMKATKKKYIISASVLISLVAVFGLGLLIDPSNPGAIAKSGDPAGPTKSDVPGVGASPKTDEGSLRKLIGRWVRPDGGYIIEIKGVEDKGRLNAAYYNPDPINVARAEASEDGPVVKVFIELRDVNYPGATYRLTYQASEDQLAGEYYQPKLGQTFNVRFIRASRPGPM
jgi:hypothetical protein